MAKLLFIPVSVGAGLLAGFVGKKTFDQIWGLIDDEEPPDSKYREVSWGRLLLAGAIPVALLALAAQLLFGAVERVATPRGLRIERSLAIQEGRTT